MTKTKDKTTDVDLDAAQQFLDLIGAKNCTFQTFDDVKDRKDKKLAIIMNGTLQENADRLIELNRRGAGVFVAINRTNGGRTRKDITRVRAVALDLDDAPVEPVRRFALKPHVIIESSADRFHAYWCVEKAFPLDKFEDVQRGVAKQFNGDPDIAKLTHCARLPGFFHNKDEPFRTRIVYVNKEMADYYYSTDEILAAFPPQAKAHRASISRKDGIILPIGAPLAQGEIFVKTKYWAKDMPTLWYFRDTWYEWRSNCYKERPEKFVRAALYEFLRKALVDDDKKGIVPFNPSQNKVNQIVDALKAGVYLDGDRNPPFWLPKELEHIDTSNLILCANGALDVNDLTLTQHNPAFFSVNALPFDFDLEAPIVKRWLKFLTQLWPDDKEAINTLQEIFGLMLTGDTSYQKIFLLVGPKRSGKGTIMRILRALLGRANVAGPTLAGLSSHFGASPLIDKRAAIIPDARFNQAGSIVTERLLSISGEDALTIDRKYRDPWTGQLGVRFLIGTNELPQLKDASGALPSRFIPLVLTKSFYGQEDLKLEPKLRKELSSILNWSLVGLYRLTERGHFVMPESSVSAVKQMEFLAAPVANFVNDWCKVSSDKTIFKAELYKAFCAWANENGHTKTPNNIFGKDLKAAFPSIGLGRQGSEGIYKGIALSDDGEKQYADYEASRQEKRKAR